LLLAGAFIETFVSITLAASTPAPCKSRIDMRQLTRSPRTYLPPGISIEFVASLACGTKEFTSLLRNYLEKCWRFKDKDSRSSK
jgi:hypothetical protein